MTAFERECFNALTSTIGNQYYIFAQIHLDALLEHKIRGQSWIGARARISQKSVDFVLCDKNSLKTILAIELDDSTHDIFERQQRDREVETILMDADIPLLRIPHEKRGDQAWMQNQIADLLRKS
jgi:very-short-patch-repair endonuclease